jgi:hypothetical protein
MSSNIIVVEFDQRRFEMYPPLESLILRIFGFVDLQIMGLNPREVKPRDLAICIALFGFSIEAIVWLMTSINDWSWALIDSQNSRFF